MNENQRKLDLITHPVSYTLHGLRLLRERIEGLEGYALDSIIECLLKALEHGEDLRKDLEDDG